MNPKDYTEYKRLTDDAFKNKRLVNAERADLLRQAAALAIPASCQSAPCSRDAKACEERYKTLHALDQRDCLNRLFCLSNAFKMDAQVLAGIGGVDGFREALPFWKKAETAAAIFAGFDKHDVSKGHAHYLAYWRLITQGAIALYDADFTQARRCYSDARGHADALSHLPHLPL